MNTEKEVAGPSEASAAPGGPGAEPPRPAKRAALRMQKSRAGQPVTDEQLALYTAARAFVAGEWFGALLMVASFTQLYFVVFARLGSGALATGLGLFLLALGGFIFWKNHIYYQRLDWPYRKRWEVAATVVAGAGVIFWLLFSLLMLLTWAGTPVLPLD